MSIESSLVKLADKIDAQGASNVVPDYKNPNNSIEKSIDRIADHYEAGGGGGTGGSVVVCTHNVETLALDKTWNELKNAASTSVIIVLTGDDYETSIGILKYIAIDTDDEDNTIYVVDISNLVGSTTRYVATSADGYPVMNMG